MPTFQIGLEDGRTLHIEADNQEAALAGAQHFIGGGAQNAPASNAPSGLIDHLRQGAAGVVGGVGETLHNYAGPGPVGDSLIGAGKSIAPKDFHEAPLVDDSGFHPSNLPSRIAEMAPGLAAQIIAARFGRGVGLGKVGQIGAATGLGTAMSAGNEADVAAANRTGDPSASPNNVDLVRGGLVGGATSLAGALPVTRFMPGTGPMAATGFKGVGQALTKFAGTAADQGLASAGQNTVGQVGQSVGTEGGVKFDPLKALDAGVAGAATGGVLASKAAARDLLNAKKYSAITPELMPAARQFGNRVNDAADGRNLEAGIFGGKAAQTAGGDSFTKAQAGVHNELSDAVSQIQTPLGPEASNILKYVKEGKTPTQADYDTLKTSLAGDPQANNILNLVQQAHASQIVKGTMNLRDGRATGGISSALEHFLNPKDIVKTAGVAAAASLGVGSLGHLITYSPEMLGGLTAASLGGRVLDSVTGARAPVGRFASNFADGTSPVRMGVQTPQPAPTPPGVPTGPTGPAIPLNAGAVQTQNGGPWGRPQAPQPEQPVTSDPTSLLQELANRSKVANLRDKYAVSRAQEQAPEPVAPQASPPPINPLMLPRDITGPAKSILGGASNLASMRANFLGQQQGNEAVRNSPFIDQKVGGAENVPDPATAKAMKQAIGSANALAKLQSDPEAEAAQKAADKASAANDKAKAKAEANTARANALSTAKVANIAAKVAAAQAVKPAPNVTEVTKANGKVNVGTDGGYVMPMSPHANKAPADAARAFLSDAKTAGVKIHNENGFITGATRNITSIRAKSTDVAARAPGVPAKALAASFEGVNTGRAADAIEHRNQLMKLYPQAAPQLAHYFSDAEIRKIWTK
jgi:hypothetical protein